MPQMLDSIAAVFARRFEPAELDEMIRYYESPVGQKEVTEATEMNIEILAFGERWVYEVISGLEPDAPSGAPAEPREYAGTVTNSGAPTRPGSLNINFYLDDGQQLGGYLTVGEPLRGSGSFTGYRGGEILHLTTRSAMGDTIVWISKSSGRSIGGEYSVVGGPDQGQKGVWTATTGPERLAVEVIADNSEDTVAQRLVSLVQEQFRTHAGFRLTDVPEPRFQLVISTMPRLDNNPNTSTVYSVVYNYVIDDSTGESLVGYLDNSLGYLGRAVVADRVKSIVAKTERLVFIFVRNAGPSSDLVFAESEVTDPPELVTPGPLQYPERLRRAGVEGRVLVEAIIDTTGHAERPSVRVVQSPNPGFDLPAKQMVLQSRFRPARVHGRAVRALVTLPIDFRFSGLAKP